MKNFDKIWQELLTEFPEIKNHTKEMKLFLKKFLAKKPIVTISKKFKTELGKKIKLEIDILKKNESLILSQPVLKKKNNWIKYTGLVFSGIVFGFLIAPLFPTKNDVLDDNSSYSIQNIELEAPMPRMAKMISQSENQNIINETSDIIPEQSFKENSDVSNFAISMSADEIIEEEVSIKPKNTIIKIPVFNHEGAFDLNTPGKHIVGCGAELIWQEITVPKTLTVLDESFNQLFNYTPKTEWLRNTIQNSNLLFESVILNNGVAKIYLNGNFGIGHCALPEIRAQIEETAFQFESVKSIEVYVNNELFDWCSISDADISESKCDIIPRLWIKDKK